MNEATQLVLLFYCQYNLVEGGADDEEEQGDKEDKEVGDFAAEVAGLMEN